MKVVTVVTVVILTVVTVATVVIVTVVAVVIVTEVTGTVLTVVIVTYFSKKQLNTLTTDEMFSGQRFAILPMFKYTVQYFPLD